MSSVRGWQYLTLWILILHGVRCWAVQRRGRGVRFVCCWACEHSWVFGMHRLFSWALQHGRYHLRRVR